MEAETLATNDASGQVTSEPMIPVEPTAPEAQDDRALMEQFLEDPSRNLYNLQYGDTLDGIIMHIDREGILVDIGSKSEGIIPSREMSTLGEEEKARLEVGDQVLVFVVQAENQDGHAVLSIDKARQEKSWRRLQTLYEAADMIEAEVSN